MNLNIKLKSMFKTSIMVSILLILIGIFLLLNPETTLYVLSYIIGFLLIVFGLIPIISFFSNKENQNYLEFSFIVGVFSFILGLIVVIKPTLIGSIIPLMIGIWMIINGVIKLFYALSINRQSKATSSIILPFVIIICGLILIFNPFEGAVLITKVIGISIIIYSLLDLIECFTLRKSLKKSNKTDEKVIDAKYIEK